MKCRSCSYSLWNIRTRTCPECGTGFKPSDFTFVAQNVRFCCPHCSQAYYGTDANGLLEPRQFECVRCGEAITLDEMVLLPAEGVRDEDTEPVVNPWLARPRRGWFKPMLSTAGRGMISPRVLMSRKPAAGDTRRAWSFALLMLVLGMFALAITILVVLAVGLGTALSTAGQMGAASAAGGGAPATRGGLIWMAITWVTGLSGGALVALGVALVLFVLVWSLIAHAVLMVTGPRSGSLGVTQQSILFTSGAMLPALVPCVGINLVPVLLIWWVVSASLAIGVAQGVRWWRAMLAGAVAPLLTVVALIVSLVVVTVPLIRRAGMAFAQQTNAAFSVAQSSVPMGTRLPELTRTLLENPPAHGVELLAVRRTMPGAVLLQPGIEAVIGEGYDPTVTPGDGQKSGKSGNGISGGGVRIEIEIENDTGTAGPADGTNATESFSFARAAGDYFTPESALKSRMVSVAGKSLDDIAEALIDGRPDALPTDATHPDLLAGADVAHRVGDLVFTYRGVGAVPTPSRDGLWLVICWPLHPIAAHLSPEPDAVSEPLSGDSDRELRRAVARARAIQAGLVPTTAGTADEEGKIAVLRADGTTVMIPRGEFDAKLKEQNEARVRAGLAELPHPRSVTRGCVITPPIAPPAAPPVPAAPAAPSQP